MKRIGIAVLALAWAASLAAADKPHGIMNLKQADVKIDGKVKPGEYPSHFIDSYTGIGVSWVSDGKLLYAALESPGSGWVAIGFGNTKVRGTSMIIGYSDGAGGAVDEHMGSWLSTHKSVEKPKLADFATSMGSRGTIIEFSIPLELSNGQVIVPGQPMPFVLAYNEKKVSFRGRPTKKAALTLVLGKPEQTGAGAAPVATPDSAKSDSIKK